jgi:hypothetical protein
MSKKGKTPASKSASNPDFDAVCLWYRMEFANYSFEVARDVIRSILEKKLDDRSPEYYAMTVGDSPERNRIRVFMSSNGPAEKAYDFGSQGCRFEPYRTQVVYYQLFTQHMR